MRYSAREGAQEAHEAIRPTDVNTSSNDLQNMERDAERLYALIWQHFVASQMPPAQYLSSLVAVTAGEFELRTKGRIMQFDGYQRVLATKEEDVVLPAVQVGDTLNLQALNPQQFFTKPAARYTEASLVKELEKRGIGRPSTMRPSSPPFRSAATSRWRADASTPRRWGTSSPNACWKASRS